MPFYIQNFITKLHYANIVKIFHFPLESLMFCYAQVFRLYVYLVLMPMSAPSRSLVGTLVVTYSIDLVPKNNGQ